MWGDVFLWNKEVFKLWCDLGVQYMFLGFEVIDEEGLKKFCKCVFLGMNFEVLEFVCLLGMIVVINIIVDLDWDEVCFEIIC